MGDLFLSDPAQTVGLTCWNPGTGRDPSGAPSPLVSCRAPWPPATRVTWSNWWPMPPPSGGC